MNGRPEPLARLDRDFAAATIAHEYAADLHRELVELHADSERSRELLGESAELVLGRMRELTSDLRGLGLDWAEQNLLNPLQAERTRHLIEARFAEIEPELSALRARQNAIVHELRELIDRAR